MIGYNELIIKFRSLWQSFYECWVTKGKTYTGCTKRAMNFIKPKGEINMIIVVLILGYLLYSVSKDNGNTNKSKRNPVSPIETLQLRYINGEIDEETYTRLSELCK